MDDAAGNPLDQQQAEFVTAGIPDEIALIAAITATLGQKLDELTGIHATKLVRPLSAAGTEAFVESLRGFRSTGLADRPGLLAVNGELIPYSGVDVGQVAFFGLARGPKAAVHGVGDVIEDAGVRFSSLSQARADLQVRDAESDQLDRLAARYSVPGRPWVMADDTYRDFVSTAAYIDAGPWWAVFRYLDKTLAEWHTHKWDGTTAAGTPQRLTSASAPFRARHVHRLIRIGGALHRIVGVDAAGAWCDLAPFGGPFWQAAVFGDAVDVEWEMMAFRLFSPPATPMRGIVYVYLPAAFGGTKPTYIQPAGAAPTPVGDPKGGQILASDGVPGDSLTQPLYIGGSTVPAITDLLRPVVIFGCQVEVKTEPP